MGTTIVIALPLKSNLWYAHVGDSRLYRWREQQLQQLTGDHTLIADMVSHGLLEVEEARRHPYRNVLSRCLGRGDLKHATVAQASVKSGDRYLLCSDGLTEEVEDTQIAELLNRYPNDQAASKELVALANAQGGHDNTTVIVITIS
jgi:protein phosphatase